MTNDSPSASTPSRPPSVVHDGINYVGLISFLACLFYAMQHGFNGSVTLCVLLVLSFAVPVFVLEILFLGTPRRPSVGLGKKPFNPSLPRILTKLLGLYSIAGVIAFFYWLFPEYSQQRYGSYWGLLATIGPYFVGLSVPYFVFMDGKMADPYDSYWRFGRIILGDSNAYEGKAVKQMLLGWAVKGFFTPLMFNGIYKNISILMAFDFNTLTHFMAWYHLLVSVMYTVDLLVACAGYTLSIRLLDSHIRSTEPTLGGWFVCLMCYPPFLTIYMERYLANNILSWTSWFKEPSIWQYTWGSMALVCLFFYTLATVNFGCRFSNLTHRGIITSGLYRFTKHPAYVAKNTFWWLTQIPFFPVLGPEAAIRNCILLLGVNIVYTLRARTEERHLSQDPDYVRYALAMNERSIFRNFALTLPFLRYKPPVGWHEREHPSTAPR